MCLLSFRPYFERSFLKAFKRQRNFVGAQNNVSLFEMFTSIKGVCGKRVNPPYRLYPKGNSSYSP